MIEVCSCQARLEISDVGQWSTEAVLDMFDKWRTAHIHEILEDADPTPTVIESVSTTERLGDEYPTEERALIGFQRNEIGGRA